MDLHLTLADGLGRRVALERALRDAVRAGRLAAGTRLPSTRELARELDMARGTVVEAIAQLAAEGYVVTRQGAATVVADVHAGAIDAPTWAEARAPMLDLRAGQPDPSTFPRAQWIAALREAVADAPVEAFGYGGPRGRPELRSAVAGYLTRARGVRVEPGNLVVCSGYAHGLGVVAAVLAERGARRVAMEDPGLGAHRGIVAGAGLSVVPVGVDGAGARVGELGDADAVVVTPAHQYPLGPALSPARRSELLRWAQRRGAHVVEDDFDGEFRFDRQAAGAVQGLDPTRVVYAGTASKSVAAGLRVGWLVLPPSLVEPVVERLPLHTHVGVVEQLTLARFIASGRFDRHVRRMRQHYRRRRDALLATLARWPMVRTAGVAGGLHTTVGLPAGTEDDVVAAAASRSLALAPLGPCWHGERGDDGLVLGYSRPPAHAWEPALAALAATLGEVFGERA